MGRMREPLAAFCSYSFFKDNVSSLGLFGRKVFFMFKNKMQAVCNFVLKHSKIAFPVIVIAAAAATVVIALNAGQPEPVEEIPESSVSSEAVVVSEPVVEEPANTEVPLLENEDGAVYSLIATYYNAVALGDVETLISICDEISDRDQLHFQEISKYIESYPVLEIYSKAGPEEGSTIVYVYYKVIFSGKDAEFPGYKAHYICTNDQGSLYIKRGENSDEVNEYIRTVSTQEDVVEFNNRITVEYNEFITEHPELEQYLVELDSQVNTAIGVILAQREAENAQSAENTEGQNGETGENTAENQGEATTDNPVETPAQPTELYGTATTTVNVRTSDSENADKIGKLPGGNKIQVLEQRVNGWSKVLFEGKEGYVKSEYIQMAESAAGAESIGTVTATTNINVRSAASEDAERLGVLAGGDSAELIANENGWCKIKYNGQVGYVKADYVQ